MKHASVFQSRICFNLGLSLDFFEQTKQQARRAKKGRKKWVLLCFNVGLNLPVSNFDLYFGIFPKPPKTQLAPKKNKTKQYWQRKTNFNCDENKRLGKHGKTTFFFVVLFVRETNFEKRCEPIVFFFDKTNGQNNLRLCINKKFVVFWGLP